MTAVNFQGTPIPKSSDSMRKPQNRKIETRKKILDVARRHVAEKGYAAARTEEIVKDAGVAKGTLFAHFGDKDQLLVVLMGEELSEIISDLSGLSDKSDPKTKDFMDPLLALLRLLSRERIIFNLFQFAVGVSSETANGEILGECDQLIRLISVVVEGLQKENIIRDDVTATELAEGCLAFLVQAVTFRLCGLYGSINVAEAEFEKKLQTWLQIK